jgi:hypothetical protein
VPGNANQELLTAALGQVSASVRERFFRMVADVNGDVDVAGTRNVIVDVVSGATNSVVDDPLLTVGVIGNDSIESLQEEMALLARSGGMAAFDVFTTACRLRNEARKLAERARRPADLADLYFIVGQGTALMASTAFDLGHWNESAALARASTQYADLAGHASLKAWTYGLRMTLANWRNEPEVALAYFARAVKNAPDGEPRLRLRYIASRSYALLAGANSVAELLQEARRDWDAAASRPDELSASIGGEFGFGEARAAACAAAAWLDMKNGEQAAGFAYEALQAYESMPVAQRPYSQINGTRIDIAAACLHMRDRDGAAEALCGVFDLPAQKRNVSLAGRLAKVERLLTTPPWDKDPEARQLAERVADWLRETSARPFA